MATEYFEGQPVNMIHEGYAPGGAGYSSCAYPSPLVLDIPSPLIPFSLINTMLAVILFVADIG